jgi:hypothetical protein
MQVTIHRIPDTARSIDVPDGSTVAQAAQAAGYSIDRLDIRVNGIGGTPNTILSPGQMVVLLAQVKGN